MSHYFVLIRFSQENKQINGNPVFLKSFYSSEKAFPSLSPYFLAVEIKSFDDLFITYRKTEFHTYTGTLSGKNVNFTFLRPQRTALHQG